MLKITDAIGGLIVALRTNTLDISSKIQLPQQDPSLMGVSVNGADQRPDQALAKANRDGQLVTLTPHAICVSYLQEVLEKRMIARGYMIDPNGTVDLQIVVNKCRCLRRQRAL